MSLYAHHRSEIREYRRELIENVAWSLGASLVGIAVVAGVGAVGADGVAGGVIIIAVAAVYGVFFNMLLVTYDLARTMNGSAAAAALTFLALLFFPIVLLFLLIQARSQLREIATRRGPSRVVGGQFS